MNISHRLGAGAAALAIATGGLVLGAGPAAADLTVCSANGHCLWSGPGDTDAPLFRGNPSAVHANPATPRAAAVSVTPK